MERDARISAAKSSGRLDENLEAKRETLEREILKLERSRGESDEGRRRWRDRSLSGDAGIVNLAASSDGFVWTRAGLLECSQRSLGELGRRVETTRTRY